MTLDGYISWLRDMESHCMSVWEKMYRGGTDVSGSESARDKMWSAYAMALAYGAALYRAEGLK